MVVKIAFFDKQKTVQFKLFGLSTQQSTASHFAELFLASINRCRLLLVSGTNRQCQAINVGFELYIGIESKLSISIIGFDF